VKSRTTGRFRKAYIRLPKHVQKQARDAYQDFKRDPFHPALQFKRVHSSKPVYSVRVSLDYRAVGIMTGDEIVWFWVGSHGDYDRLLKQL
jgi:mRNA-degrading endonuclease RelE of RelBE toxin-antitoxin system